MKNAAAIFAFLRTNAPPPYLYWRSPEGALRLAAGMQSRDVPPPGADWRTWLRGQSVAEGRDMLPRVFIMAFDPATQQDDTWEGFPAAEIWRPSVMYCAENGVERFYGLDGNTFPEEGADTAAGGVFPRHGGIQLAFDDAGQYRDRVQAGLLQLQDGALEKIVLARSVHVELSSSFDPLHALSALQLPHSFGVCYSPDGEHFFLSATPERLARVEDGSFSTMALAGTMTRAQSGEGARDELLADAKERAEHAYVIEMIREALAPCSIALRVDDVRLLTLPHITHILTHIEGQLLEGHGMLDVVSALHPTPAVAGTPRDAATEGIRLLEDFSRGLYAGCVGWVDGAGNGDAAVTIRSAVVHDHSAHAFAGAGIVAGSDPADEEAETRAKLQTMLDVLGA
jgi:isochorismate synthase